MNEENKEQVNNPQDNKAAEATEKNTVEGATEMKANEEPSIEENTAAVVAENNTVETTAEEKVNEEPPVEENTAAVVVENNTVEATAEEKVKEEPVVEEERFHNPYEFNLDKLEKVSFASAVEGEPPIEEGDELPAILGLEKTKVGGGGKFEPNKDPNRPVVIFDYPLPGKVLKMRRNGKKASEGVTITDDFFCDAFDKWVGTLKHKDQLNFLLTDNSMIVGYVVKPENSRPRVYIPIHVWPEKITPPTSGFILKVRVKKLIIG